MSTKHILHIDATARAGRSGSDPRGSHTRRLTHRFIERWRAARPTDAVTYRDVGREPPKPVSGEWIAASFTPPERLDARAKDVLAESDTLANELIRAHLVVIGAPMYNFGIPAQLKAWIDNVVRVGLTFGFDRSREGKPYWPMLAPGKKLVILTSRGDYGYNPGERLEAMNLVERGITVPMGYLGLTEAHAIAIEYDEFADERLAASICDAEKKVDEIVDRFVRETKDTIPTAYATA